MSRRDDLIALRDAGQDGDFVKFRIIAKVLASEARDIGKTWPSHDAQKAMSGSVDAALAFLAAVLPGAKWSYYSDDGHCIVSYGPGTNDYDEAHHDNPARALLIATLNALIGEME